MQEGDVDIAALAELARIALTPAEAERLRVECAAIVAYVSAIQSAPVSDAATGAAPDTGAAAVNVFRADEHPHPSGVFTDALLAAAPRRRGGHIAVKKVLAQ